MPVRSRRRVSTRALLAGVLAAVVVARLCYLGGSLYADEAGYLLVARQWHLGGPNLYGFYFVDRPPGLLLVYRLAALLQWDHAIRLLTIPFAVLFVLSAFRAVHGLVGERGARWAAVLAGALVVSPLVGAQEADGEIFAVPLVMLAVALTLAAVRRTGRGCLLPAFGAGLSAAAALMVKQNFADAFVFAAVLLAVSVGQRRLPARDAAWVAGGGLLGGLAVLLGVLGYVRAAGVGLHWAWYSLVGFRGSALEVITDGSLHAPFDRALGLLGLAVVSGLLPMLLVLLRESWRCQLTGPPVAWAVAVTLAVGFVGIVAGGSYWPHYLLQLAPMTVLAVGVWGPQVPWLRVVAGAAVASAVVATGWAAVQPVLGGPSAGALAGAWVGRAARPHDTLTVLYGNAQVQEAAGLPSPYPQLWSLPMRTLDPHLNRLGDLLAGPRAPDWVVVRLSPDSWDIDRDGTVRLELATHYRKVAAVCGHPVWLRDGESRRLPPTPAC